MTDQRVQLFEHIADIVKQKIKLRSCSGFCLRGMHNSGCVDCTRHRFHFFQKIGQIIFPSRAFIGSESKYHGETCLGRMGRLSMGDCLPHHMAGGRVLLHGNPPNCLLLFVFDS
jgi:hypothetical protein